VSQKHIDTRVRRAWNEVGQLCLGFAHEARILWSQQPPLWEAKLVAYQLVLVAELKRIEQSLEKKHHLHGLLVGQLRILAEALSFDPSMRVLLLRHFQSFRTAAFQTTPA
jgi:hypothetical protein